MYWTQYALYARMYPPSPMEAPCDKSYYRDDDDDDDDDDKRKMVEKIKSDKRQFHCIINASPRVIISIFPPAVRTGG